MKYRKLNETKDRFLSILSHDLRAPTASIIGMVNALIEEPVENRDELKYYLELVHSSAKHQLNLITNLLDWSNIESGKEKFNPVQRNLKYAVREAANSIQGLAHEKNIKIISSVDNVNVLIDGHLFERLLINLLSNALKFSHEHGSIEIESVTKKSFVEISVCDHGVGIPEEVQQKLSDTREKVTTRGTKGERGTGLGLNLCKEIVNLHGGELWIESPVSSIPKQIKSKTVNTKKENPDKVGTANGTKIHFTMKQVAPKIFISNGLVNRSIRKILREEENGYKLLKGEFEKFIPQLEEEYFSLMIIEVENIKQIEKINSLCKQHGTTQNLWRIVPKGFETRFEDETVKSNLSTERFFTKEEFNDQFEKELQKHFFELNQQKALVKQS